MAACSRTPGRPPWSAAGAVLSPEQRALPRLPRGPRPGPPAGRWAVAEPDRLPAVIQGTVAGRLARARRHPVVPVWIRDEVTRKAAARYAARHVVHLAAFHGARSPKYLLRTVAWSPRGAWRTCGRLAAWALDAEAEELRTHAVVSRDFPAYHRLAQDMVTRALGALGIPEIRAALKGDGGGIDYRSIPYRDGPGWRVDLDL